MIHEAGIIRSILTIGLIIAIVVGRYMVHVIWLSSMILVLRLPIILAISALI